MMQVITEPQYGDGNIIEVMMVGSHQDPKVNVRDVPLELLYPSAQSSSIEMVGAHLGEAETKFLEHLKEHGMRE